MGMDMFAGLSRRPMPETYNHLDEIIADLQEKMRRRPIMRFLKSAHAEMKGLKEQLNSIVAQEGKAFDSTQTELFKYRQSQLDDIVAEVEREIAARGGSVE